MMCMGLWVNEWMGGWVDGLTETDTVQIDQNPFTHPPIYKRFIV